MIKLIKLLINIKKEKVHLILLINLIKIMDKIIKIIIINKKMSKIMEIIQMSTVKLIKNNKGKEDGEKNWPNFKSIIINDGKFCKLFIFVLCYINCYVI
jgi:hypothetical protein